MSYSFSTAHQDVILYIKLKNVEDRIIARLMPFDSGFHKRSSNLTSKNGTYSMDVFTSLKDAQHQNNYQHRMINADEIDDVEISSVQ